MTLLFRNRRDAGRRLARELDGHADHSDVLVLALPRGGVPVAFEVARALGAELDVLVVRKLGVPGHPETAMGAIAANGRQILDRELIRHLRLDSAAIERVIAAERQELARRERLYREGREPLRVAGRRVIVIDDGLATGASMAAALQMVREMGPARLIAAVPVASPEGMGRLGDLADEVVCLAAPEDFRAVGLHYREFDQTSDDEVRRLLAEARACHASATTGTRLHTPLTATRAAAVRLSGSASDYDLLISQVGDRDLVLIGEASHGTREFYRMRAEMTRRLIMECGFDAVAVEADWPDAYSLNRNVRGMDDRDTLTAFDSFERFPEWMWRNREVYEFIIWLKSRNAVRPMDAGVGFYGLDLYSLYRSADAVIDYLEATDPEQAMIARRRYACLDHVRDPQQYGLEAVRNLRPSCREAVTRQLIEMRQRDGTALTGNLAMANDDERFHAERNATVVRNAEMYYRAMFGSRVSSWNLRDDHMADTLFALQAHLRSQGRRGRIVVWAHNSHLGDARATSMGRAGEWNLGQRVRERVGPENALLVGFTTYTGYVSAAHDWGEHVERMRVRPALEDSIEHLFYCTRLDRFCIPLTGPAAPDLQAPMLERAIGVIYRPETERASHYFDASLSRQFDLVFHLDETEAVEPLYEAVYWYDDADERELPETYPFGV
ncbi:erythromycin esterase family protein [Salinisphaera hydrothermalis]|uniref:erythromycin esterase family protein n=1 Tax=Salinisphaera hydrothermalis TaxID=563188 RepID=UPI00334256BA